ncbi:hypothetical protein Ccrd_004205 [Cynara cardunculus var. scolymus]|uniref:BSD domain-containing protein n=1 Tax=Cynara cardunculus var. scolymus TaxID=59895 RepID=A0A118JW94_CYNCS|nr:hypothetical protein Ccrd_004205 [Cynara cardunculus var. scolymus]
MPSSWFSLSLPNPFNSDDDQTSPPHSPTSKPDFSLITQTIGRQLHNVASFLAPPPQPSSSTPPPQFHDSGDVSTSPYGGIKNDLAEIGGSFKIGLSLLSSNKAVSEISKFASNLLQFDKGGDEIEIEAVGITNDVVDFVQEISLRPECWIDFPLSLQHKDHASAIEELVPSLTTLRHKVQSYMSEQEFWVIYFILLLPRLNEDECRLLSTPEIVQVREVLLQKLRKKNAPMEFSETENPREPENRNSSEKGFQVNSSERIKISGDTSANRMKTENNENCELSEQHHEDDVSFSDLEDEDNDLSGRLSGIRQTQSSNLSSASESGDWIRLNETQGGERKARTHERRSESEGSSDWLTVEDVDL